MPPQSSMVPDSETEIFAAELALQAVHREQRGLDVARVDRGLDQQKVGAALDQALGLLVVVVGELLRR